MRNRITGDEKSQKTFKVYIPVVSWYSVEVGADDEEHAKDVALDVFEAEGGHDEGDSEIAEEPYGLEVVEVK